MQVGKCGSNLRITENEHTYVHIIPIVSYRRHFLLKSELLWKITLIKITENLFSFTVMSESIDIVKMIYREFFRFTVLSESLYCE